MFQETDIQDRPAAALYVNKELNLSSSDRQMYQRSMANKTRLVLSSLLRLLGRLGYRSTHW